MTVHTNFRIFEGLYTASSDIQSAKTLPSGVYEIIFDTKNQIPYFKHIKIVHDKILDLPTKEFISTIQEIKFFLKPETKKAFEEHGCIYKRSSLLYGDPGTGKTILVSRIANEVVAMGGVVLFNPSPEHLQKVFEHLTQVQPDIMTMVIFEELDKLIEYHEGTLLSLLDGEVQKNNIIYMATTNYIDKIPKRIRRPSRFSTVLESSYPDKACRECYLRTKLSPDYNITTWVEITDGFTIDELKESFVAHILLQQPLKDIVKRIKENKGLGEESSEDYNESYKDFRGDSMEKIAEKLKNEIEADDDFNF